MGLKPASLLGQDVVEEGLALAHLRALHEDPHGTPVLTMEPAAPAAMPQVKIMRSLGLTRKVAGENLKWLWIKNAYQK